MSLRTIPGARLHGIIEAVGLVVSIVCWAAFGFPYLMELAVFGGLVVICVGAFKWMESQP